MSRSILKPPKNSQIEPSKEDSSSDVEDADKTITNEVTETEVPHEEVGEDPDPDPGPGPDPNPSCDPIYDVNNPPIIQVEDITASDEKIEAEAVVTPCIPPEGSEVASKDVEEKNTIKQATKTEVPHEELGKEEIHDPACDPNNPQIIQFEDVTAAAYKIKGGVLVTPCIKSHISKYVGMEIYLKMEFLQATGSFKERGARYALLMLTPEQRRKGIIASSAGNHAQAVSYHGQQLKIPVTVVMPAISSVMKIQKCKQYAANVIVQGKDLGESYAIAMNLAKEKGFIFLNGFDHPHIIAGQGTIALELNEQVPDADAVIITAGGGGLLAGISLAMKALKPSIKIIGVESERCPSFSNALKAGKPIVTEVQQTLAEGLAVPMVGYNSFATAKPHIDKMVEIKEQCITLAILRLIELEKIVVEGAGAAGLGAILGGYLPELKGKKVILILSGGNIDTSLLGKCLERGMAAEGRLVKIVLRISDRPGGIAELCTHIASIGVSIRNINQERAWLLNDLHNVEVTLTVETRDYGHSLQLKELLSKKYENMEFVDFPSTNVSFLPSDLNITAPGAVEKASKHQQTILVACPATKHPKRNSNIN